MSELLRILTGEKIHSYFPEDDSTDDQEFADESHSDDKFSEDVVQQLNEDENWTIHAVLKKRFNHQVWAVVSCISFVGLVNTNTL